MVDEYMVSHYFKRATMLGILFGNEDYHMKRYSEITQADVIKITDAVTPSLIIGVILGALVVSNISGSILMLIYAFLLFNIALLFFFWQDRWQLGNIFPTNYLKHVYGSSIGFISTIIGIGGGSLSTPLLKIYNFEIHRAIGTAAGIGAVIAMPGTIGFIISGIYNELFYLHEYLVANLKLSQQ